MSARRLLPVLVLLGAVAAQERHRSIAEILDDPGCKIQTLPLPAASPIRTEEDELAVKGPVRGKLVVRR